MISVENVTKYYGAHAAVADLTFTLNPGEVIGLLGLNGAGKTTTLRILSGLLVATSGRVRIGDIDMTQNPEAARARIGFLPETPPLYQEMSVIDFLTFVAHIKGVHHNTQERVRNAVAQTQLSDVANERISTLSHGFQKRIGIAQAIVHQPELILLDEPTSGLDPRQIIHMRELIRSLSAQNTVIVVSSHLLGEIQQVCDRIFVLQKGRIAAVGTEEQLAAKVSNATRVHVEVRGAAAAFSSLLDTHRIPYTIDREERGITCATVELQQDGREDLSRLLIQSGFGLRRLEQTHLELENIFLKLTGLEAP